MAKALPKKRIVVAVAEDSYVLEAVIHAKESLSMVVTLVGDKQAIVKELLLLKS